MPDAGDRVLFGFELDYFDAPSGFGGKGRGGARYG
jgi:hypothetical protein